MAVALDAQSTSATEFPSNFSSTQTNTNLTITAAGTLLLAGVSLGANSNNPADMPTCSGVTWNGVSLGTPIEFIAEPTVGNKSLYLFGLINPAIGNHTLSATFSGSTTVASGGLFGVSFKGTDTTSLATCVPSANIVTDQSSSNTNPYPSSPLAVTTASGDAIFGMMNVNGTDFNTVNIGTFLVEMDAFNPNATIGYNLASGTSTQLQFSGGGTGHVACAFAVRIVQASAAAAPPTGWQSEPDQLPPRSGSRAAARYFDTGPALALTPSTLPPRVAGMAWFERHDQPGQSRKIFLSDPPAFGRPIAAPISTIAGMPWAAPRDEPVRPRARLQADIAAPPAVSPPLVTWSFSVGDTVFVRDVPIDGPPALALVPSTLPPKIAGIGWFQPAPGITVTRKSFDSPPAFGRQINAPPSTIAGMAWASPQEAQRTPRAAPLDAGPAIVFAASRAPVGAWLVQPESGVRPKPRISDSAPAGVFTIQALPLGGWFNEPDLLSLRMRPRDAAPAQSLRPIVIIPPVGVSGMAWFAPPDRDRTWARVVYDYPPAFDPQFVLAIPPSETPTERIIRFAAEARGIRFAAEHRTIRFGADSREIEF